MDDLDLLKKDWKKQEDSLPRLSYDEIYKMLWKRSHSIVRWIFVISILEFLLYTVLNIVLADDEYWARMEEFQLTEYTIGVYVISYLITFYFIFRFYRNYRRISATDNASLLMENILRTRRTVKYYIGFVLISSAITFVVTVYLILKNHVNTVEDTGSNMAFDTSQWLLFIGGLLLVLVVFLSVIWLIYRVIYGILLKRLKKNYKQLQKLEV